MILGLAEHCDERRRHLERARDLAEVEGNIGADEVRAVGRVEAFAEDLCPASRRHPPERVARNDVVRVELEAAPREPAGHVLYELGEVRIDVLAVCVVGERVLLVGAERELAARGAAEGEPRPGGRGRPACRDRELDEARGQRVLLDRVHCQMRHRGMPAAALDLDRPGIDGSQ